MKFVIKFEFQKKDGLICSGEMVVWSEDVRYALRFVEYELDTLGAKVLSVNPLEEEE